MKMNRCQWNRNVATLKINLKSGHVTEQGYRRLETAEADKAAWEKLGYEVELIRHGEDA
jgi:hypothetical protein